MPTKTYVRFWCSECKEFTLQEPNGGPCKECGTVTTSYKLSEVPEEKLVEQRARYNKSQYNSVLNVYGRMLLGSGNIHSAFDIFSEVGSNIDVREDDAGQLGIDEARKLKWEERKAERKRLEEEYQKFKGTGRNDSCPCGSGIKYKKCCQSKYKMI